MTEKEIKKILTKFHKKRIYYLNDSSDDSSDNEYDDKVELTKEGENLLKKLDALPYKKKRRLEIFIKEYCDGEPDYDMENDVDDYDRAIILFEVCIFSLGQLVGGRIIENFDDVQKFDKKLFHEMEQYKKNFHHYLN